MGGAPRNPAPRNHFSASDCQTTRLPLRRWALDEQSCHRGLTHIVECRPLSGALPPSLRKLGAQRGSEAATAVPLSFPCCFLGTRKSKSFMCVYVYVYIYIYIYVYTHTYIHIYIYVYMYVRVSIWKTGSDPRGSALVACTLRLGK